MQAVAVGLERVDRSGPGVPVLGGVLAGEGALEDVHAMLAIRVKLLAPREATPDKAPTRCELPLGFGRQASVGPSAECERVIPRDVDRRVVLALIDRRPRPFGMRPVGARNPSPPWRPGHALRRGEVLG